MKSLTYILLFLIVWNFSITQDSAYIKEIKTWQAELDEEYLDPVRSPLSPTDMESFSGHAFYPIQEKYKVEARFEATPDARPFPLGTSKGTTKVYKRIGILHFELEGQTQTLEAYVEQRRFSLPGQQIYVFLPLVDETTGRENYGAGRYMHYEGIPEGDQWLIDFNKLYNPYCAYSDRFECPKVPEANYLEIPVRAGVKGY